MNENAVNNEEEIVLATYDHDVYLRIPEPIVRTGYIDTLDDCGNNRKLVRGIRKITLLREKYRGNVIYFEVGLERCLDGMMVQTYVYINEACLLRLRAQIRENGNGNDLSLWCSMTKDEAKWLEESLQECKS